MELAWDSLTHVQQQQLVPNVRLGDSGPLRLQPAATRLHVVYLGIWALTIPALHLCSSLWPQCLSELLWVQLPQSTMEMEVGHRLAQVSLLALLYCCPCAAAAHSEIAAENTVYDLY